MLVGEAEKDYPNSEFVFERYNCPASMGQQRNYSGTTILAGLEQPLWGGERWALWVTLLPSPSWHGAQGQPFSRNVS